MRVMFWSEKNILFVVENSVVKLSCQRNNIIVIDFREVFISFRYRKIYIREDSEMKKITLFFVSLAMFVAIFAFAAVASADDSSQEPEWTGGSVYVGTGIINHDANRTDMQYPSGKWFTWLSISWWLGGSAELYNDQGEMVDSFDRDKEYTFTNLKEGKYTVIITWANKPHLHMFQSVDASNFYSDPVIEVEISKDNPKADIRVVAEYRAFDYNTITDIGTFRTGTNEEKTEKDYFPVVEEKTGNRNWAFEKVSSSNITSQFSTHSGIYYGDSASQYNINTLEVPVLSDEEEAKGYIFDGWRLVGGDPDVKYNDVEALGHVINKDTVFKAAWKYPTHEVTFKTSKNEGTIDPASDDAASAYSYKVDFNNQRIGELKNIETLIPEVTAKDGYIFEGWYMDLTMDTLTEDEIKSLTVDKDIVFYAKYNRVSEPAVPGTEDTPEESAPADKPAENKTPEVKDTGSKTASPEVTVTETVKESSKKAESAEASAANIVDTKGAPESSAKVEAADEETKTKTSSIYEEPKAEESEDTKSTPETSGSEDKETVSNKKNTTPASKIVTNGSNGVVKSTVTTSGARRYSDVSTGDESDLAMMWAVSVASLAALMALARVRRRKTGR